MPHNRMQIKERRDDILVLLTKGMKGYEIAKELGVDASTVSRDIHYLIARSHNYLNSLAKETLPFMYQTSIEGIKNVLKECWNIYSIDSNNNNNNDRDITWFHKIAALKLAKECNEALFKLTAEGPSVMHVKLLEERLARIEARETIGNLAKKLDRLDPKLSSSNRIGLKYWKDKPIIPLEEWIKFRDRPYPLDYFLDDFDQSLTYMTDEYELGKGQERKSDVEKWNSDFIELMEHTRNPNYGKLKCFHCLLSPARDDPIFIGINGLVAKGLVNGKQGPPQYPCEIVNRFQCPYEGINIKRDDNPGVVNSNFDVEDLFKLEKMAFAVEISLAKARKEDSGIRVKNEEELLHALTDKGTLAKILEQGTEAPEVSENIRTYLAENRDAILDYFMKIKDKINLEELRFY